ncbi:PTS sugar transporter subunit IIA [Lacticaseibacillus hulanensis]|uniref:PTS sugar transporter subunit IIA n=1 Tax=Lacticaseibacillus hulanensis TaxID=2493111 RepID=UPI000FDB4E2C|nr:PTS fructose transporter subunit IIA [Lacticaseibacillus hulanensis]
MSELVLISHGDFCHELKKSAEMIMGPQDNIYSVGLQPSEGPEDFEKKLLATLDGLTDYTVFADLMGGTPCNVASRLLMEGKAQFELYAGMNLPMLVSFINGELLGSTPAIVDESKAGIVRVNDVIAGISGK